VLVPIEVAFADEQRQIILSLAVQNTCSLEEAINHSGILQQFPQLDLTKNKVGMFGKIYALNTPVVAGGRIEIYAPLIIDPKKRRRERAQAKQQRAVTQP
jgi:uncharacterized protein